MKLFYQSFLLRIWINRAENSEDWCASLEEPDTHQIHKFDRPSDLFEYLIHTGEDTNQKLSSKK